MTYCRTHNNHHCTSYGCIILKRCECCNKKPQLCSVKYGVSCDLCNNGIRYNKYNMDRHLTCKRHLKKKINIEVVMKYRMNRIKKHYDRLPTIYEFD